MAFDARLEATLWIMHSLSHELRDSGIPPTERDDVRRGCHGVSEVCLTEAFQRAYDAGVKEGQRLAKKGLWLGSALNL